MSDYKGVNEILAKIADTDRIGEPDTAQQKLEELKAKAREKYSDKEIDDFVNMGKKIASKTVLTALKEAVMVGPAKGDDAGEAQKICAKIDKLMPYNYCGYVNIEMKEISSQLNLCLSIVPKDYKTDISIPSEDYVQELYSQYDYLRKTAIAYWHTWMGENPDLLKRIADYRRDVDFSKLRMNRENATTLFWDEEANKRIGIFAYYTDGNGRAYYKNTLANKNILNSSKPAPAAEQQKSRKSGGRKARE